jgi:hypothetical protein
MMLSGHSHDNENLLALLKMKLSNSSSENLRPYIIIILELLSLSTDNLSEASQSQPESRTAPCGHSYAAAGSGIIGTRANCFNSHPCIVSAGI